MRRSRRTLIALLPVFLIISSCGGGDDDATPKAATDALPPAMATMSGELHALLPDDIREAGVIKTGGPVTDPPTFYLEKDAITRTGDMADFANAVGDLLGVEIEHIEMPFNSLEILAIATGRETRAIRLRRQLAHSRALATVLDKADLYRIPERAWKIDLPKLVI